ncbi:MAG: zinc-binding dehydrogenase, partial [Planctomycetota bacterium]
MRAVIISRQGEPVASNVEVVDDWPEPRAVPGWLIVRTEASGLNYLDLYVGKGVPGLKLDYPRVPGADACGRVESVGQGVDPAWIGRRVVLNAAVPQPGPNHPDVLPAPPARRMIGEHDPGTHAEKFAAPATNVLDVGDGDAAEAAAYGLSHLTAWRMLVTRAGLRAGRTVLITGTSGGTAQALLNIARLFGCTTIVTSRRQHHLDRALELGADHGVLDTGEDWSRQVRGLTGKRGVDVCADSVGKALHLSCIKALARGGIFVTCGATTGPDAVTDLARVFWNELTLAGSTMG